MRVAALSISWALDENDTDFIFVEKSFTFEKIIDVTKRILDSYRNIKK